MGRRAVRNPPRKGSIMTLADTIRSHVVDRCIEPARRRGEAAVTVAARDVLRDLGYRGERAPAVCSALRAKKFLEQHDLEVEVQGPRSKQSTTTTFTYRLSGRREPDDGRRTLDAIRDLRGVGRETFAALGGGERWLRREREAFHADAPETPGGPESPR